MDETVKGSDHRDENAYKFNRIDTEKKCAVFHTLVTVGAVCLYSTDEVVTLFTPRALQVEAADAAPRGIRSNPFKALIFNVNVAVSRSYRFEEPCANADNLLESLRNRR